MLMNMMELQSHVFFSTHANQLGEGVNGCASYSYQINTCMHTNVHTHT